MVPFSELGARRTRARGQGSGRMGVGEPDDTEKKPLQQGCTAARASAAASDLDCAFKSWASSFEVFFLEQVI